MLEVRNLTKKFNGVAAVENVSFTLRPGEILGYVGPNGAGKSTTVKMIIGLLDPSEGQILFRGKSIIDDLPGFQARIGYVPEESHLYPHLSGREYLQLVGRLRGLPKEILEPKIDRFLSLFSLQEDANCPVSAYSKGMRQKILISAALMHNPELLILDEPLSGLDVTTALVLRDLLQGLAAQGRMILFSSHVLDVLEKVCSGVLILCKGKVAAHDTIERLRESLHETSLEGIFGQLTREKNHRAIADDILEVMQA
ncbi:MAG TPA: ABC transporter ATP-binding protein [Terriglobia bacterium]|nr:ABC transporter ATP-binding protein [Terriglobia bacterium]